MSKPLHDSAFLYGLHDPGGEHTMLERNTPGWVLVTVKLGANPNDQSPGDDRRFLADYRQLSGRDLGVFVRLNHGYSPEGTLPYERQYDDFARRCANFVRISRGCSLWIVGNEPNHPIEWPGADWDWNAAPPRPKSPDKEGEKITPERYARCYRKVRDAIRSLPDHSQDLVLVAGAAPWNNLTTYAGNPNGDWVQYLADVLKLLGPANCDGIALHAYTHGTDPSLVRSEAKVGDPRFQNYHWHFRTYRDFMNAIPANMRQLPVYITETDQGDVEWANRNSGWVREAYKEIDEWNQGQDRQKIGALVLYRWPRIGDDRWWIEGKQGVIEDFQQSMAARYQVAGPGAGVDLAQLKRDVDALAVKVNALQPRIKKVTDQAAQATQLARTVNDLTAKAQQATATRHQVNDLAQQVAQVEAAVRQLSSGAGVAPPPVQDLRATLPAHPTKKYDTRPASAVRRVVVHHTGTKPDITPQRIAQFHVGQGLAGIKYHYMIGGDGAISWTQPPEAITPHTALAEVNADGVAVAIAGTFNTTTPNDKQMASAAQLIAWLLDGMQQGTDALIGRIEVDTSDPTNSPGKQWLQGAKYKEPLVAQVQAILEQSKPADDQLVAQLRQRVRELEAQVADLQAQAAQVAPLQREVQELRNQVDTLQANVSRLSDENSRLVAENARLWAQIQNLQGGSVRRPAMQDIVDKLPRHPTLPPYDKRTAPVRRIVVHHTDTPPTMTVQQIADYHINGIRKDAQGNVVKAQWPGIAYHYVIAADGTIFWTQRPETRSYHAGNANNDSVGVSLIGRFMRRNWNGTAIPVAQQTPTPEQMRSASHLIAWLMQEHGITRIEQVVGHKEVSDTSCPGDQWLEGVAWKNKLHQEIQTQLARGGKVIEYCLLFWDRGALWAEADLRNAADYIAHFRPPILFSAEDAMAVQNVVIVGGTAGTTGQEEQALRNAGCNVFRLAGANEAETKAMLDALVRKNTPYPGAPPAGSTTIRALAVATATVQAEPVSDEWTIPDDWEPPAELAPQPTRVKVELFGPPAP